MTKRNPEALLIGRSLRIKVGGRLLPVETAVFPEDFPDRLRRLKEASGLTWTGFAWAIGVDLKQLRRWLTKGVEPSGGPLMALLRFAALISDGGEILLGEGYQLTFCGMVEEEEG